MWQTKTNQRPYPFRHNHANHFPPKKQKEQQEYAEEVPIMFLPHDFSISEDQEPDSTMNLYPQTPPPISTLPSISYPFPEPSTPSAAAPAHLTVLLQELLTVMNTIMSSQQIVQEEDALLSSLTDMVATLQQEAEDLVQMADLVEEYVEEISLAQEVGEIEEWVDGLGLRTPMLEVLEELDVKGGGEKGHGRNDSGVGLDDDDESGVGFTSKDGVVADAGSISENEKREGMDEERMDFKTWVRDVQDLPVPLKSPKRVSFDKREIAMAKEKKLQVAPESPQKMVFQSRESREEKGLWVPPKRPKRPVKRESPKKAPAAVTARLRKEKPTKTPPQFRDSGLDVSSPAASPRKKPMTRWI